MIYPAKAIRGMSWLGVCLGLFVCSVPLAAVADEFVPASRGTPARREGGGTRGLCVVGSAANSKITALVPQTNIGYTTAEYPRFFWYMPQTRAKFVEFALFEASVVNNQAVDQKPVYKTRFSTSGKRGVVSLDLPSDANIPPLEVGKDYHWSVKLICDTTEPKDSSDSKDPNKAYEVDAWVQRVKPTNAFQAQLNEASPRDRVRLYAKNGLWFDAITTLAELRCAQPQNESLVETWAGFMQAVQLPNMAQQPLIQKCGS